MLHNLMKPVQSVPINNNDVLDKTLCDKVCQ